MKPLLQIDLISLFPEMARGFINESMLKRAALKGLLSIELHDLRGWAAPPHYITDDRPFGGGAGMVLQPEPLFAAIEGLKKPHSKAIYLCPDGIPLSPQLAKDLSSAEHLVLVSGHYEGIDERVREALIDQEISIGDYVLTNGTLAAVVLIDAVSRYVPGVLGDEKSLTQDSFNDNLLSFPQYTRPSVFRGMKVPEVLLSGNHKEIENWRKEKQIQRTNKRRPDLRREVNLK